MAEKLSVQPEYQAVPPSVELIREQPLPRDGRVAETRTEDQRWNKVIERANRYSTDGVLYVAELPVDIRLADKVKKGLTGESVENSNGTDGIGYASREIGKVVSQLEKPDSLFAEGQIPPKSAFEKMLKQRTGGEAGTMLSTLLMDAAYPYEKQEGDGYTELPATDAANALKVSKHSSVTTYEAQLCAETEKHFSHNQAQPVQHNGEDIVLQKTVGDNTALLLKPAIINGVRIPVGSVLTVNYNDDGKPTFAFGRLSAFCFSDPHEGMRQFPDIFNDKMNEVFSNDPGYLAGGVPQKYVSTLENFNRRAGRESTPQAFDLAMDYMDNHPEINDPVEAAKVLLEQMDQDLATDPDARFVRGLRNEKQNMLALGMAAAHDQERLHEGEPDPRTRAALVDNAQRTRRLYYKFFGPEVVKAAERHMDQRDDMARYINVMNAPYTR